MKSNSDEEDDFEAPKVEMTEVKFGTGFVDELYKEDVSRGTPINVTGAWEAMLAKKRPTSSLDQVVENVVDDPSEKGRTLPGIAIITETGAKTDEASDDWSQHGEEGSGEYGAKITSPIPMVNKNFHWNSLEFGTGTYGKLGLKSTMQRMWNGINILDKRTVSLRSFILEMNEKQEGAKESQLSLWEAFSEHEAFTKDKLSRLEDEKDSLKTQNEFLMKELKLLKMEHEKTQKVLLGVIEHLSESVEIQSAEGKQKVDQEVPIYRALSTSKAKKSINAGEKLVKHKPKEKPIKDDDDSSNPEEQSNKGRKAKPMQSEKHQDTFDVMAFLDTPLMNPNLRRQKIEQRLLPKPLPNKDALNALPKYGGPTARLTTEELQRKTLTWLSSVEGVVLSQEATIQDVYDRLPNLLEDNARTWLQQTVMTTGHFKTWNDFRQALLTVFLGSDWKLGLERSFNSIHQNEKEPGVNYVLRVWSLAKQIDPLYLESAILAKIATTMKPDLWSAIPRDERSDYFTLLRVVAAYDEENNQTNHAKEANQKKGFKSYPSATKDLMAKEYKKKICYLCSKEGHISRDCPNKRLVASTSKADARESKSYASGKGKGALLGTK